MNLDHLLPSEYEEYIYTEVATSPDPNEQIDDFHALHWAGSIRSIKLAKRLLKLGLDPNGLNFDGSTALTWSPSYEFTAVLIEAGARVGKEASSPFLSLHRAAETGRADQLGLLLSDTDGHEFIDSFNEFGDSPLAVAAMHGHFACVQLLLQKGACPNAYDMDFADHSSLQHAVSRGHERISELLLAAGANPYLTPESSDDIIGLARDQLLTEAFIRRLSSSLA
jgi:ankyrin repeat protein